MAPHTPQRSERPGEAVALLDAALRLGRFGEAATLVDAPAGCRELEDL
jgi:hypothetical protein